jgi:hypothetical protein
VLFGQRLHCTNFQQRAVIKIRGLQMKVLVIGRRQPAANGHRAACYIIGPAFAGFAAIAGTLPFDLEPAGFVVVQASARAAKSKGREMKTEPAPFH